MQFSTKQPKSSCGIALHARSISVCIVHQAGALWGHRNLQTSPEECWRVMAPYREPIAELTRPRANLGAAPQTAKNWAARNATRRHRVTSQRPLPVIGPLPWPLIVLRSAQASPGAAPAPSPHRNGDRSETCSGPLKRAGLRIRRIFSGADWPPSGCKPLASVTPAGRDAPP